MNPIKFVTAPLVDWVETDYFPLDGVDGWELIQFEHEDEGHGDKVFTYRHADYGLMRADRFSDWVRR